MNITLTRITLLSIITLLMTAVLLPLSASATNVPTTVKKLNVIETGTYRANLKWKRKGAATYYKVQLLSSKNANIKKWKSVSKRKKNIKKKTGFLEPGKTYKYRVKACNEAGCSNWSKKKRFSTLVLEEEPEIDYDSGVADNILALEAEVFELINNHRLGQNLPALERNPGIAAIARGHSVNMANGTTAFSHDGFSDRFTEMLLLTTGSGSGAENVAFATDRSGLAQFVADGWVDSPGHKANIENSYTTSGMGVAYDSTTNRYYFTQLFLVNN